MDKLFSLSGKTALVTGGTRGIGLMIAEALVTSGVKTYISSRDKDMCQSVSESLTVKATANGKQNPECLAISADLSSENGVTKLANTVKNNEDHLDILINNAAIHRITPLESTTFSDFTELMNTNVASLFILVKELLPLLKKSGNKEDPSRIINMGSSIVLENAPWDSFVYAASKAAIHQLTRDLAHELAGDYITVNCLAPSSFPSRMVDQYLTEEFTIDHIAEGLPLKRVGRPEDMAGVVRFLCSDAGSFITGNIISNDGGISIK